MYGFWFRVLGLGFIGGLGFRVNETASPPLSVPWKTMPTPASWGFTGAEFKVPELADALLPEGEGPAAAWV